MKKLILFVLGCAGLVAAVYALRGNSSQSDERVEYYASGRVQSECPLHAGVRDGECKRYWPDGKLQAQGRYADGAMSGDWSFWNEDGTPDLARAGRYENGELARN
jgi:antitoxin component YwqK of YwqJK toxin-antitoxin module